VCTDFPFLGLRRTIAHIQTCFFTTGSTNNRWPHFLETLDKAPHLIRHVHHIEIVDMMPGPTETLVAISRFPITHLKEISLHFCNSIVPSVSAAQQLLSSPTLRRATIYVYGMDPSRFLERCSPSLRHLEYWEDARPNSPERLPPATNSSPSIPLESLRIPLPTSVGFRAWRTHPLSLEFLKAKGLGYRQRAGFTRVSNLCTGSSNDPKS